MADSSHAPGHGLLPWLVGALALWSVSFPVLANVWEFIPRRPTEADHYPELSTTQRWGRFTDLDRLQTASEKLGDAFAKYGEFTGLEQGWNMFTPEFPPHTVVPIAELDFPTGGTARVESRFAPQDPDRPRMRWPLVHDREFNYEANITMLGWHASPEVIAAHPEIWSRLPERVQQNEGLISHWLAWKMRVYRAAHPGASEPGTVMLVFRYIPTRLPSEAPDAPRRPTFERPFARWFPAGPRAPGLLPVEGYDPVANRFVPLKAVGPP
jgi:hypothetical protein